MSSSSVGQEAEAPHPLLPGASPATIRSWLLPEDRATFVAAYEAALDEARRTLDLAPLHELVEDWRGVAVVQSDPARFRRMVRRAAEIVTGDPVPDDEPFAVTRTKAGLQGDLVYEVDRIDVADDVPNTVLIALAELRAALDVSPHDVARPWLAANPTGMRMVVLAESRAFVVCGVLEHERRVAVYECVVL